MNRDQEDPPDAGEDSRPGSLPDGASFRILEHTADVGILARGPDREGMLAAAALGLFSLITDLDRVRLTVTRRLRVEAASDEDLLHDWLETLNTLHQVHGEFYASFAVTLRPGGLEARVRGEAIDPSRHDLRMEVKAVTWHELSSTSSAAGWEGRVLLDI